MSIEEKFLKIIKHYGIENQLKKLSEEIYELQEAILLDVGDTKSLKHICEERADVDVLLRQIDEYFGINYIDDVSPIIAEKLNRQLKRIENDRSME